MRRHPTVIKLLKRPEPEELEEEEKEEEAVEEEAEGNEEEGDLNEDQQEDSPGKGSPTEQAKYVGIVVENRKEKEAGGSTAEVKSSTAEGKGSKEAVSVESKKDNVGTRLGGPVNRVGSPAPTRGGVEQRPGGKTTGKDPVRGAVQGGPKVGSDQKSPSTSGGQRNGNQTRDRGMMGNRVYFGNIYVSNSQNIKSYNLIIFTVLNFQKNTTVCNQRRVLLAILCKYLKFLTFCIESSFKCTVFYQN